jgi:hypothetical protein
VAGSNVPGYPWSMSTLGEELLRPLRFGVSLLGSVLVTADGITLGSVDGVRNTSAMPFIDALSPAVWYIVGIVIAFLGVAATVAFLRTGQRDWIALAIALVSYCISFGLILALPAAPAPQVMLASGLVGAILLFEAFRRALQRGGTIGSAPPVCSGRATPSEG